MSDTRDFLVSPAGKELLRKVEETVGQMHAATQGAARASYIENIRYRAGVADGAQAILDFLKNHE